MRVYLISIVLSCYSMLLFSQNKERDSILKKVETHTVKDTVRVKLLINAANYIFQSAPQKALTYVEESLNIANKLQWQKGLVFALRQKGNIYYITTDKLKAMEMYLAALEIAEKTNHEILISSLYNNLANIYADMKQYDKALENYNKNLDIAVKNNSTINHIMALNNIGNIYNEIKEHDNALIYFNKALSLSEKEDDTYFMAAIINNIGLVYEQNKEYNSAINSYKKAIILAKKIDNKFIEASALNSIGQTNILLNEFDKAKNYAEKSLLLSKEISAIKWQSNSWKVLHKVYENYHNDGKALFAYKNYISLRDSVLTEEKKAELTKKEMQYQLEKQEVEANAKIKRQAYIKNTVIIIGSLLLLFSVIGFLLNKRKRDANQQKNIAEFNAKIAETELKALRSQMNPHFIFNSLNSISDYLSHNNVKKADEYLLKFSKLTRAILENSEKKWIPLNEDLELLKLYIEIESLRLKNKLTYEIKIDESIDIENTLIPPLILQPFIENSIWHGISKKETEGNILIEINKNKQKLICAVEDTGVGRNKESKDINEKKSMGMHITNQRLDIINKTKQVKGTINFIDKKEGLRVELVLPLELKF